MGLYANLRPVRPHPAALNASPIKPHLLTGVDILVVRELTGGIYFGEKTRSADSATDLCTYSVAEIERVVRSAFKLARQRRGYLVSVDKANVLEVSRSVERHCDHARRRATSSPIPALDPRMLVDAMPR